MYSQVQNVEIYEFFDDVEYYIKIAKNAEGNVELSKPDCIAALSAFEGKCDSFVKSSRTYITDEIGAKRICEQFIKLYYSLKDNNKCINKGDFDYNKCSKFLNYWINFKLRKSIKNGDSTFCNVYGHLDGQLTGNEKYNIYLGFIDDIDKDDLYKMNILYNLYVNYSELKTIINTTPQQLKRSLLPFSTECCTYYIQAKYICNDDNNKESMFCQKLKSFKSKYNDLYNKFDGKRSQFSDNLLKLEECPNNKIITTAVTGSIIGLIPLLGILYKVSELNIKL
ncbi:hypothetical protein PVIIG_05887 [Plasmodium vivax India VII]|uniref:Uncharacterized protein n=1 Tax=Plasmodium vivax India VII TaxID=1077284 RepID=A0A0J9S227_PLAVI|nr:hypothetical protein PVIIG_05887 [Plasmodium vivax India VII]